MRAHSEVHYHVHYDVHYLASEVKLHIRLSTMWLLLLQTFVLEACHKVSADLDV